MSTQGPHQHAYFLRRLDALARRIERRERDGLLPHGQAAFMQQDLVSVGTGIGMILQRAPALSPDEERSYRAMLDRVEMRLIRAEARRATPLAPRDQSAKSNTGVSSCAFSACT